jgi:hypothetical protein
VFHQKKKAKIDKKTKFMMTKKEPEHFLSSGQGKSFFSEGKSILSHYRGTFPWKVGIKKFLEHWVRYL